MLAKVASTTVFVWPPTHVGDFTVRQLLSDTLYLCVQLPQPGLSKFPGGGKRPGKFFVLVQPKIVDSKRSELPHVSGGLVFATLFC